MDQTAFRAFEVEPGKGVLYAAELKRFGIIERSCIKSNWIEISSAEKYDQREIGKWFKRSN